MRAEHEEAPLPQSRRREGRLSAALSIGLMSVYIAAKAHFFLRFGEIPVRVYLAEHWLFWATALVVALPTVAMSLPGKARADEQ